MARALVEALEERARVQMKAFFNSLSEKDRRRYAAVEAVRLGHGGIRRVAEIVGCSARTIARGIAELELLESDLAAGRVRRPGAGQKKDHARLGHRAKPDLPD